MEVRIVDYGIRRSGKKTSQKALVLLQEIIVVHSQNYA